ncbi:sensor histidine kinase [Chitinophaga sp. GCM10012297]|uniref:histidine kinase n=1 Tax=Chitinophaga chungangae TaxID=2821488 RepID=A0ABS3YBM6_9BACT|nr:HAMP domain-containing sensor histidine kinase [Chitinophaga chungangae]MBO9152056.1 HAMP domain-containing histidine kinase [Chitinophaga chungangae]
MKPQHYIKVTHLLNGIKDPVLIIEPTEGIVEKANKAAIDKLGLSVTGKTLDVPFREEFMLPTNNGAEETCIDFIPSSISIAQKEYVLAIGKTTASEQHLRMQLRNLEQERALQEMKTSFISMTSHEFRTPLTAIAAAVDLLETRIRMDRMMNPFYKQNIAKISDEIFNLNTMLDEILTLSKIVSNNYEVKKTPVNVSQVVDYLKFQYFSERKDERKLEVKVVGEPRKISVDKDQLSKILTNLISNAFKYSTHENPQLKLHYHARKLVIAVVDHGIGIPEKDIPHLFNSFYRGSNVDGIDGTGLGLAIVKTFTEMNGGEIKVTSEKGKGTKFSLTFRYA